MKDFFIFAVRCLKFIRILPNTTEYKVIKYQFSKSSTSSSANYEEFLAGSSRADFTNKIRIALSEIRESNYCLRIIGEINGSKTTKNEFDWLIKESKELKNILGSIVQKKRAI